MSNIEIDAREDHPTLVFFQDRATRATLACDRATGRPISFAGGVYGESPASDLVLIDLERAARLYFAERA